MPLLFVDGGNQVVTVPTVGASPVVFTILAWIFPTAFTNNRAIVEKSAAASVGTIDFRVINTSSLRMNIDFTVGDGDAVGPSNALLANQWNIVATSFDTSGAPTLYAGTLASPLIALTSTPTNSSGTRVSDVDANVLVGNKLITGRGLPGQIGPVAWFNSVLPLPLMRDVAASMLTDTPLVAGGCQFFMNLGAQGDAVCYDISGYGRHGVNAGAATVANTLPMTSALLSPPVAPYRSLLKVG